MTIKLTVSYDGTSYCGWQNQKNGLSVQQVLEDGFFAAFGKRVNLIASGRTDAGVHAEKQVVSFNSDGLTLPPEKFSAAVNSFLPDDVKILKSERAPDDFNARKSAKRKTYRYSLYFSETILPLKDRYSTRVYPVPDVEKMKSAAEKFIGTHDFKAFCASGSSVNTTVRTIYSIDVTETSDGAEISVCGNGFLYNMVRTLCGTLIKCGYGEYDDDDLAAILNGNRSRCGKTLPAKGLTLLSVEYR